jgi:hypothetical protein
MSNLEIQGLLVFMTAFVFACILHRRTKLLATAYDLTSLEDEIRRKKDIYRYNATVFQERKGGGTVGIITYLRADGEGDLDIVKQILEFDSKGKPIFNSACNFARTFLITNGIFFFCWGIVVCSPYVTASMSASEGAVTVARPALLR